MSKPRTLASSMIYTGRIFDLRIDEVREDDLEYKREIVVHKGSAVIVPVFDDGTVALVRQYRHAAGKFMLEVPAGSLEIDEDPLTGAIRELEEEVGVVAEKVELITEFYVSPGFLTEKMYVFLATSLNKTAQNLDGDENIAIERIPLAAAVEMSGDGRIEDAKSIIGLMMAGSKFGILP